MTQLPLNPLVKTTWGRIFLQGTVQDAASSQNITIYQYKYCVDDYQMPVNSAWNTKGSQAHNSKHVLCAIPLCLVIKCTQKVHKVIKSIIKSSHMMN